MHGGMIPQETRLLKGVISGEACYHCARWATGTGISPATVTTGESTVPVPVARHKTAKNKLNVITGTYMTR